MSDIKTDPRHLKLRITSGIETPRESLKRLCQDYQKYQEEEEQNQQEMDSSRLSTANAGRLKVIREAQTQERVIRERLKKDGTAFPPYKFLEMIGKGSYGRVYKCTDLRNGRVVALKVLDADTEDYKAHTKNVNIDTTLHEIKILMQLSGGKTRNVNPLIDAFSLHSQIWIVNEYCPGGSIKTLSRASNYRVKEKFIRPIARELAEGLKCIHEAGIIHRDIKGKERVLQARTEQYVEQYPNSVEQELTKVFFIAANIMIHEKGELYIIDFGVAGVLPTKLDKRSTMIGSLHWMPPEMHLKNPGLKYGTEVDVWAYGCTLIECALGHPPNPSQMRPDGIELLKNPPRLNDENYSSELRDFIAFILQGKPADRPTMAQICKHPYIAQTEQQHPTRQLSEMVVKYKKWEEAGGQRLSLFQPGGAAAVQAANIEFDYEDWNFSTSLGDEDDIVQAAHGLALQEISAEISTPQTHSHRNHTPLRPQNMDNSTIKSISSSSAKDGADNSLDAMSSQIPQLSFDPTPQVDDISNEPQDLSGFEQTGYTQDLDSFSFTLNENLSPHSQNDATITLSDRATKEELSVMRGERSLQAIFQPPTSDLPLRSGESTTTHSQELQYDAGIGPSGAPVPTVDLSNVAHAKANAQNRRKTMEWTFPKADTSNAPEVPSAPRARPELKHSVTAPVGLVHDISGTLNLDDMWGDDYDSTQSSSTYAFAGGAQAAESLEMSPPAEPARAPTTYVYTDLSHTSESLYLDPPADDHRFSGTIDMDAMMAMGSEDEGPATAPAANLGPMDQGDSQDFTLRPNTQNPRPPLPLNTFRRGDPVPELPPFPYDMMKDDMSEEELIRGLQGLIGNFCDTLGALHDQFEDDGDYDDETGELRQ
ncbi:hypothetical protein MMC30_000244 [Trapelia coarctata]|nr:hypothetical protein [Trapelia coarctata]